MYGNCYDLGSPESPALLLRKQSSYLDTFKAKLSFNPRRAGYEAGVTLWWNQYIHASVGIGIAINEDGQEATAVVVREPSHDGSDVNVR